MRPKPDDADRRPVKVVAEQQLGSPRCSTRRGGRRRRPRASRRAMPSISATARSAVLSVRTSGVLPTGMPRARRRLDVDVVDADRVVGDRPQPRRRVDQLGVDAVGRAAPADPRARAARASSSSRGGGRRSGQTSTSCSAASRSRAPPGSLRVTKTFTAGQHATIRRRGAFDLASSRGHGAASSAPRPPSPRAAEPPRPAPATPAPPSIPARTPRASRSPAGWRAPPRCATCRRSCP